MSAVLAQEHLLMAAAALDAAGIKNGLQSGVDLAQVDRQAQGLLHLMLEAFQTAEEAITQAHAGRHGLEGFQKAELKEALLKEHQALKEKATLAFHAVFMGAPEGSLDLESPKKGFPPVIFAASLGLGQVLSELVKAGANPDIRTPMNSSALHQAALKGNIGCLRRLAGFKVPVNTQDQQGRSAAHMAASNENLLAMRELKRMGVDFSLRNTSGRTAADELGLHDLKLKQQWEAWENRHEAGLRAKRLDGVFNARLTTEDGEQPSKPPSRRPRF